MVKNMKKHKYNEHNGEREKKSSSSEDMDENHLDLVVFVKEPNPVNFRK